ncbi:MAG: protein-L-isoaspartate(D-aspartate) O-methyltransferase [Deferribacteraceae bacterium]|jgi:protein-L-isoaspartate(D-aspartate) O-methyltransferase|nr:protein-L-isoaspartate(D-aspartate) O-methyltransferase [Deferribacteraceae bacterium]
MLDYKTMKVPEYFIDKYIRPSCHDDQRIVEAFNTVPRQFFMDNNPKAYTNDTQPIGMGQTISQPSLVAEMLYELEIDKNHKCLEIGAGSGFVTALLSKLADEVFALELLSELRAKAQEKIRQMKIINVRLFTADGALGFPDKAPYDRILVSAGAKNMPKALEDQLAEGGIMIIPLNDILTKVIKNKGELTQKQLAKVRFVDFVNS